MRWARWLSALPARCAMVCGSVVAEGSGRSCRGRTRNPCDAHLEIGTTPQRAPASRRQPTAPDRPARKRITWVLEAASLARPRPARNQPARRFSPALASRLPLAAGRRPSSGVGTAGRRTSSFSPNDRSTDQPSGPWRPAAVYDSFTRPVYAGRDLGQTCLSTPLGHRTTGGQGVVGSNPAVPTACEQAICMIVSDLVVTVVVTEIL